MMRNLIFKLTARACLVLLFAALPLVAHAQDSKNLWALRFEAKDFSFKKPLRIRFGERVVVDHPDLYSEQKFKNHIRELRQSPWIFGSMFDTVADHLEREGPGTMRTDFCEDVLTPLEALPIRIMERRGILSPSRAQTILQSGNLISPSNITFILNSATRAGALDLTEADLAGALKVVSGQGTEVGETSHLPFEFRETDDGSHSGIDAFFSMRIDRQKYKYAWEIGRFTSTSKQGIAGLVKVALQVMQRELALYGGSLDEAFVFGHAITGIHRRLYEHDYGMTLVKTLDEKTGEAVLQVSLKKLIEQFADARLPEAERKTLLPPAKLVYPANESSKKDRVTVMKQEATNLSFETNFAPTPAELRSMIAVARQHLPEFNRLSLHILKKGLLPEHWKPLEDAGLTYIVGWGRPWNQMSIMQRATRGAVYRAYGQREPLPYHVYLEANSEWIHSALADDALKPEWTLDPSVIRTRLGW